MASPLDVIAALTARERHLIAGMSGYADDVAALPDQLAALAAAITALAREGVAYALIGGIAVGIRSGVPRATIDVDLAVPADADRERLAAVMTAAGFRLTGSFEHSINFRHPSGEPVQLALDPAFDPMIARAEAVAFGDGVLRVVTSADLIAMKRRAAADPRRRRSKSLRDLADVALLEGDVAEDDEGW